MTSAENIMKNIELEDDEQVDFLEVDNPLPGQNYGCISFISPEKELAQKHDYYNYNFYKYQMKMVKKLLKHHLNNLKKDVVDEKVSLFDITEFEKQLLNDVEHIQLTDIVNKHLYEDMQKNNQDASELEEEKVDYVSFTEFAKDYKEEYENYKVNHEDRMQAEFNEHVDFQTNIRGVKLRGNFESYKEAKMRAKLLQRKDPSFHVWVAQVGYWVPFDADPDKAPSSEYQEEQLQRLAEEKKKNEEKREFLQEQRRKEEKKLAEIKNKKTKEEQHKLRDAEMKKIMEESGEPPKPELEEPTETLTANKIEELLAQRKQELDEGEQLAKNMPKPSVSDEVMKQAGFGGVDPWMSYKMEEQAKVGLKDDDDDE